LFFFLPFTKKNKNTDMLKVTTSSSSQSQHKVEVTHYPPTIFCSFDEKNIGSTQKGVCIEFRATCKKANSFFEKNSKTSEVEGQTIGIEWDLTPCLSFLRRSVTVIAEPVAATLSNNSFSSRSNAVGNGENENENNEKNEKNKQQVRNKRGVAVPGFIRRTTGNDSSASSNKEQHQKLFWIGKLDLKFEKEKREKLFPSSLPSASSKKSDSFGNVFVLRLLVASHMMQSPNSTSLWSFSTFCPMPCLKFLLALSSNVKTS
jgi:hypothetical protein